MKLFNQVLILALLLAGGNQVGAQLLPLNGTNTFVKGANLPWLDGQYDHDIGINPLHPGWGCAYNSAHMNQYLADMHNMGITVVRLWLNENKQGLQLDGNGNVTGLDPTFLNNLDNLIQLAGQNGIYMYLTLNGGDSDWLTNITKQASYVTNAVAPLATRYKGNPHLFAFDVMNEIDGVVGGPLGNYGSGATWPQAQAYITATVSAIHSADPGRLATCSTGWHQWNNLSYFLGLGLDFYDFHNYQDTPSFPAASSLGMDKPIYIGECGQSTTHWDDSIQNICELDALNSAKSGGYAGVGIWAYQFPGCSDYYSMVNTNASWRPVGYTIQGWNYGVVNTNLSLSIQLSGTNVMLTWERGTLLESTNLHGPWATNLAGSPYTVFPANPLMFYQVQLLANPISINFSGNGTLMAGSENAGVVAETNWNNVTGGSGNALLLNDATGNPSGATVSWSANSVYNTAVSDSAGNNRMMRNYLDTGNTTTTTVTVGGLPANAGGWNIYVYFDGSNGETREGTYTISGMGVTTTSIIGFDTANTDFSGTFVQAAGSAGNYMLFSIPNVSGFTVSATPVANGATYPRAPVNGVQIIPR
jgi:hypothetical protein